MFLIAGNSVFNFVTSSGIFTSDAKLMLFSPHFFLTCMNQTVGIEQCLDSCLTDQFLCFFYCYYLFAVFLKLPTVLSGLALNGKGEVPVF